MTAINTTLAPITTPIKTATPQIATPKLDSDGDFDNGAPDTGAVKVSLSPAAQKILSK
jgi:hypothetical protein